MDKIIIISESQEQGLVDLANATLVGGNGMGQRRDDRWHNYHLATRHQDDVVWSHSLCLHIFFMDFYHIYSCSILPTGVFITRVKTY